MVGLATPDLDDITPQSVCLSVLEDVDTGDEPHVIINLIGLEKTSRPGNVRGYLQIEKFCDESSLCPMDVLIEYFNRVRN